MKKNWWPVIRQPLIELAVPALIALAWAFNKYSVPPAGESALLRWFELFVQAFFPGCFFANYLFRSRYQTATRERFGALAERLEQVGTSLGGLVNRLEERSAVILGTLTGGDGYCSFSLAAQEVDGQLQVWVAMHGEYPLSVLITVCTERRSGGNVTRQLTLGTLPLRFIQPLFAVRPDADGNIALTFFCVFPGGMAYQHLHSTLINGKRVTASEVTYGPLDPIRVSEHEQAPPMRVRLEQSDPEFPRDADGKVIWLKW